MGLIGRYIDSLPDAARDRVIEAQTWCVAEVLTPQGARCLVGHAEDWMPLDVRGPRWRRWMDGETGGLELCGSGAGAEPVPDPAGDDAFAFRRACPADMGVYLRRLERWGVRSERRIGARFDRLCARIGLVEAIRVIKRRAGRRGVCTEAVLEAGRAPSPGRGPHRRAPSGFSPRGIVADPDARGPAPGRSLL